MGQAKRRTSGEVSCAHPRTGPPEAGDATPPDAPEERGAALVEFAVIALLLAGIIFTTIDYGRFAQLQNRMSNAAREGAAYGQLQPCDTDGIEDRAGGQDEELVEVDGYSVDITYQDDSPAEASGDCDHGPGDRVIVEVRARITMHSPFAAAFVGEDVDLSRTTEAVIQG